MNKTRQLFTTSTLLGISFLLICSHLSAGGLDSKRPHLDKLDEHSKKQFNTYYYPFLIAQTAKVYLADEKEIRKSLITWLKTHRLKIKAPYNKGFSIKNPIKRSELPIPETVTTKKQLEGLHQCSKKHCKHKLNTKLEKALMGQVNKEAKVTQFHTIVLNRVKTYLKKNQLKGYEDRADNNLFFVKSIDTLNFIGKEYPNCNAFIKHDFWKNKSSKKCAVIDSFLKQEISYLNKDELQPLWRVSHVIHLREGKRDIIFEIHIYTNHFFDSSMRVYEFRKLKTKEKDKKEKKAALIITDVMEIDTLKISAFVRMLYGDKISSAVLEYQLNDNKHIKLPKPKENNGFYISK